MNQKQVTPLSATVEPLIAWYEQDHRSLPWRDDPTPYHVWLSEIMLQQTRIEAVIPYYERFLAVYPTVAALAAADNEQLMKLWEGLGYYSRARNLKKAAACIMEQHGGKLPADYEALRALPGIGAYTAGAIASIAFGLPEPAVDGNVLRVITRLTADRDDITKESTKRRITEQLREIYPHAPAAASAMTQALMELGERVCVPNGEPHCDSCPLGLLCLSRAMDLTDCIPVRTPKKPRRQEIRTIFLIISDGKVALVKRPQTGLLAGLWEFPCMGEHADKAAAMQQLCAHGASVNRLSRTVNAIHIFTHIEWHMQSYIAVCDRPPVNWNGGELVFVTPSELKSSYALPTAYRAYLKVLGTI
ncbi:MAG: A/G-specific adenine glycosylase [Clostridia bacterium]|nr:A/G-specific adenine glycosylase [Clostridia bacterium]